jgi:non-specific serine/threonine protein kinase
MAASAGIGSTSLQTQFGMTKDGFFGRERETADVLDLLSRPDLACLTIVGPGGVGKTRLVQRVASTLAGDPRDPFPEGIWFVPLASVSDVARVPAAIGQVLSLELTDDDPLETLVSYLREREALLILDNVEQVIEIASLVARIAAECHDVKIIVTSRRPLRIGGEQEFALSPLPLPETADEIEQNPAVALFIKRAHMVNPGLQFDAKAMRTIAEICRGLDGLPLAIELAASRVKALSPAVLATHLGNRMRLLTGGPRDAPIRQQALRSTISWSYDLLTPEEQRLYRWLSVFTGGFSFEAVELLAERLDATEIDLFDTVASLVDHSLLLPLDAGLDEPRWTMLQTIREFGLEMLVEAGEEPRVRRHHVEVIAQIVSGADPGMYGVEQPRWIKRLTAEDDNIWAAMGWAIDHGEKDLALSVAAPLWRYWSFRHLGNEGRAWLAKALAMPGDASPVHLGMALRGAGCLAEDIADYPAAEAFHHRALAIWEEIGDDARMARTLDDLGNVAHDQGQFEPAIALHTRAWEIAKAGGNRRGMASALSNLGATAFLQGDVQTARERWQSALDSGVIDDPLSKAMVMNNLGAACLHTGDLERAATILLEALELHRQIGTMSTTADILINLNDVMTRKGERERAREYFDQGIELYRQAEDPRGLHNAYYSLGCEEVDRGNHQEALIAFAESLRQADRAYNLLGVADAIEQIATFAAGTAYEEEAARLAGAARAIRSRIGTKVLPSQETVSETLEATLSSSLGPTRYDSAFAEGGQILPRQATARALTLAEKLEASSPSRPRTVQLTAAPEPTSPYKLTKREVEVLRLLAEGRTDRDIAAALFISHRTAGTHVANILGKLEVDTRAAAVAAAFRHGLM